jgi:hypothetical protein
MSALDEKDRAAVRALVERLPTCDADEDCTLPAVAVVHIDGDRVQHCEEHAVKVDPADVYEFGYADALRVLLDRMKGWTT